jgi:hypothetical protein
MVTICLRVCGWCVCGAATGIALVAGIGYGLLVYGGDYLERLIP